MKAGGWRVEEQDCRQEEAGGGEQSDISTPILSIKFLILFFFIFPTVMCLNVFLI